MKRTYHYCATAQNPAGGQLYTDGTFVLVGPDAMDMKTVRTQIGQAMSPPQERPILLSITLIHQEPA